MALPFAAQLGLSAASGLLGLIGSNKASRMSTVPRGSRLMDLANKIENLDISQYRDIARQAAPSYQDLSRLSAATGGSTMAATMQARQAQTGAMDTALNAFRQQQMSNQGLLANIYGQEYAARQSDLAYRRQSGVDIFNNIANLGFGMAGQAYGANLQKQQNKDMFNSLEQYSNERGFDFISGMFG